MRMLSESELGLLRDVVQSHPEATTFSGKNPQGEPFYCTRDEAERLLTDWYVTHAWTRDF